MFVSIKIWIGPNSSLHNRLARWGLPLLIHTSQAIYLSNVRLNSPPQTQHNKGVGGCNKVKPNVAIKATRGGRQLRRKFQHTLGFRISSDIILEFGLSLTHPYKTDFTRWGLSHVISLSNVELNSPPSNPTQWRCWGCNEGKPNAAIKATRGLNCGIWFATKKIVKKIIWFCISLSFIKMISIKS